MSDKFAKMLNANASAKLDPMRLESGAIVNVPAGLRYEILHDLTGDRLGWMKQHIIPGNVRVGSRYHVGNDIYEVTRIRINKGEVRAEILAWCLNEGPLPCWPDGKASEIGLANFLKTLVLTKSGNPYAPLVDIYHKIAPRRPIEVYFDIGAPLLFLKWYKAQGFPDHYTEIPIARKYTSRYMRPSHFF